MESTLSSNETNIPAAALSNKEEVERQGATLAKPSGFEQELDAHSLEKIVEMKISRFLDQLGTYYPENLHSMIMGKAEKPLLNQILRRTGGNQVQASKILGINRNTLRKKIKIYDL